MGRSMRRLSAGGSRKKFAPRAERTSAANPGPMQDDAQGFSSAGVGILFDGGGRNSYTAPRGFAQGCAMLTGDAILWSGTGDDTYVSSVSSQAATLSITSLALLAGPAVQYVAKMLRRTNWLKQPRIPGPLFFPGWHGWWCNSRG